MKWFKGMVTRGRRQEQVGGTEVSDGLGDHLKDLVSFVQGDYKSAREATPELLEQLDHLREKTSGIEGEIKEGRDAVVDMAGKVGDLRRGLSYASNAIKKAAEEGQDVECLVQDAAELVEKYKDVASDVKQAVNKTREVAEVAGDVMPDIVDVATKAGEVVERQHSTEQKLTQMVERGLSLVSTTSINNVAERFKESARRQSRKILYLWIALFGVVLGAAYISIGLWNSWKMDEVKEGLPLFLILRSAILGGLTTLIVFLYRAMKPAEQERKNYEMKSNVLASSMAVHKESLSAPLQRVVAEELGWKAVPSRLNMYLRQDNTVCLENLLNEDINVAGYGVICWDKDDRRIADYSYHITAQNVLAGHESMPVLDKDISEVSRVEVCDGERNVVARWTNKA